MALIDTSPKNKTLWQRLEECLLAETGGDKKLTSELLPGLHAFIVEEKV